MACNRSESVRRVRNPHLHGICVALFLKSGQGVSDIHQRSRVGISCAHGRAAGLWRKIRSVKRRGLQLYIRASLPPRGGSLRTVLLHGSDQQRRIGREILQNLEFVPQEEHRDAHARVEMIGQECEHLLADNHLVFRRGVNAIEKEDDRRPRGVLVLRPVGGHVRGELRGLWDLALFLPFELLKREERKLLRLSVFEDREVLLAETIFERTPGRVSHHDIYLHQPRRRPDHRGGVRRVLLNLGVNR